MSGLALLAVTGVLLYGLRASFIVPAGRLTIPAGLERLLEHARPAVLAALLVSVIVGGPGTGFDPAAVVVAAVAMVAASRLSFLATTVVGLATIGLLALA
ncbi:MAG TPA: AzlD domain-containing protein [Acidimicrobiia bacterium]